MHTVNSSIKNIIVLRGGALGDFLLTLPAISALRNAFPNATLSLFAYSEAASLVVKCGVADKTFSLNHAGIAQLFSDHPCFDERITRMFFEADLVLNYLNDPDQTVAKNLKVLCGGRVLTQSPFVRSGHASGHFLQPLQQIGLKPGNTVVKLKLDAEIIHAGKAKLEVFAGNRRTVAIHPGSGGQFKNWPLDRFLALAGILRKTHGFAPFFITGEADTLVLKKMIELQTGYPVFSNLSLEEIGGILGASDAYIGNDSGITHLAAVVGTPLVVALFGPTNPEIWAPAGPNVRIVGGCLRDMTDIGIEEALRCLVAGQPLADPPRRIPG